MLGAISGIGLTEGQMVTVFTVVAGYVQGVARTSVDAARLARATGVSDEEWWSTYAPLLADYIDAKRFPTLASVWAAEGFDEADDAFEFGLQRLLDGIETFVQAASALRDRPQRI
jgi:hypothetical protein